MNRIQLLVCAKLNTDSLNIHFDETHDEMKNLTFLVWQGEVKLVFLDFNFSNENIILINRFFHEENSNLFL
jgi:hypothetical protein